MARLFDDAKYSFRIQAKNLGFTSIALLTVALSVGASTAVFSVVNAIMLKPLPYADAERIVVPWRLAPKDVNLGYDEIPWGITSFQRIAHDAEVFQNLTAFKGDFFNLTGSGEAALIDGVRASAGFFATLGVRPLLGRTFTVQEDQPSHEHEVVLSYDVWHDRLLADPGILGRTVDLNGQPYAVVGVMPAGFLFPRGEEMPGSFGFPRRTQLWVPLALPNVAPEYAPDELAIMGRLKPGITLLQAQAIMRLLMPRMEQDVAGGSGWFNSRITPLTRQVAGDTRMPLLLTLGAVGVVLLIACSNVGNLLLARSLGRTTEFSLRAALGAGRRRLVLQLLIESLLLAAAGGVLGILMAAEGIHLVKIFGPANIPRLQEASLDFRVFAFAVGITVCSGILFGLAPALAATRGNLAQWLRAGGRGSAGSMKGSQTRNALLVLEVALALVLVIAAGLLVQTFLRLLKVDPGFNAARVLTFELSLPTSRYKDEGQMVALYRSVLLGLRSIPGVNSAGVAEILPMDGATDGTRVRIPDRVAPHDQYPLVNYSIASSGFFSAVGNPIFKGRAFLDTDTADSHPVAIINRSMAKKFWPGKDPIGKQVAIAADGAPLMTIIGIVDDVKHLSLRGQSGPEIYVPFTQKPFPSMRTMHFVLRSKTDPNSLAGSVRAAVRSLDPDLAVAEVRTLQTIVNSSVAVQRFSMLLLGAFAAIAMVLAFFGTYGVISYSVNQRTREIGVRMALGAKQHNVLAMLVGQGMGLAGAGIAIGLPAAAGLTRLMESFLYGVRPTDA
ncbi:MAG: ABC transporter permease, partial [Acidobacteriaceae bacterium]|nr:ABC transporter permease [Acidobacteriaceae bacterium]